MRTWVEFRVYRWLVWPWLSLLPPEAAHRLVVAVLRVAARFAPLCGWFFRSVAFRDPALRVRVFGRTFENPIGLAAGFDKDAEVYAPLGALGFGFVEVGTVTAKPQSGNPRPRLFRLARDRALINRMGFNNCGAEKVATRLAGRDGVPVGVNIGKTRAVAASEACDDYARSARVLGQHATYLVINVSSPNTPGLRDLQDPTQLQGIVQAVRGALRDADVSAPLLVKIAPDLSDEQIAAIADTALALELDGIIATNTTTSRAGLTTSRERIDQLGRGGLSGRPLRPRATHVLRQLRSRVGDRLVLVSVGGIESVDDVWDRIRAGATLVQVYTALVYHGPLLPARLARGLAARLAQAGFARLEEAIGIEAPSPNDHACVADDMG